MSRQDKIEQESAEKEAASQSKSGTQYYVVRAFDNDNDKYVYIVTVIPFDNEPNQTVAAYLNGKKLNERNW
jgi:hypothetical protein